MQTRKCFKIPTKTVANRRRPLRKFNLAGYKAGLRTAIITRIQRPVEFCLRKLSSFRSAYWGVSCRRGLAAVEDRKEEIIQREQPTRTETRDTIIKDHKEVITAETHHQELPLSDPPLDDEIRQFCLALAPLMHQINACPDAAKRTKVLTNIEAAIVGIMNKSCNK